MKEEPTECPTRPFNYDVVDVSKGFLTRIPYKKKVKSSKLDSLLERRLKQHIIEEKQRQRVSASNPEISTPVSSTSTLVLSTPVRPRSPLKPHTLGQTKLSLGEAMKVEEKSSTAQTLGPGEVGGQGIEGENWTELSKSSDESVTPPLPSPAPGSTPKDNCSIGEDSASPQNQITSSPQELEEDLVERTKKPCPDSSAQEDIKLPDVQVTTSGAICSSLEKQTGVEVPNLKSDIARTSTPVFDSKSSQNTSPKCIQENLEKLSSAYSGTEENGIGPVENQENIQGVRQGRTEGESTLETVSPLPQVNGNDDLGRDGIFSNSVMSSNNGVLTNNPQTRMNSIGKVGEQGLVASMKDGTQRKPLVNGDLTPVKDNTEAGAKEPNLASKTEVDSKPTISDQDYKPPLKMLRVENNVDALGANTQSTRQHNSTLQFQSAETNASPVIKIIRMAPSPIPSAEESSLSDDFAEENCQSGTSDPIKTIFTQVTTSTTTIVSTETTIVKAPSKASEEVTSLVVSTKESSAVSTFATMTKTTVTKICSSGLDGQSEDSQSEIVTQEQISASASKSTTGTNGETSVSSVAMSQEDYSLTKGRVRLLKFSRTKKTRSDTALPSYRKFVTKSSRKSIFVLPHDDLKVLGRRGGFREVPIFSYNAKPAWDIWPYPSPRPTFGITWR